MSDLSWEYKEGRNHIYMESIITRVSKELRTMFIERWNSSRYKRMFGAWSDTRWIGEQFWSHETRLQRCYAEKIKRGDTKEWDVSVLTHAILSSHWIGYRLSRKEVKALKKLRDVRNKIAHTVKKELTDKDFRNMTRNVKSSLKDLGLSTHGITKIEHNRKRNESNKSFKVLPPKPTNDLVYHSKKNKIRHQLDKLRSDNKDKLTYFCMSGNPGCGKSVLARQLGEDLYKDADRQSNLAFVMRLDAKNSCSLLKSYKEFCVKLNCDKDDLKKMIGKTESEDQKIKDLRSLIEGKISNWKIWWLIVDNVDDLNIWGLLPGNGDETKWKDGQIIVTIRNTTSVPPESADTKHISLSGGMDRPECHKLLSTLSGTDANDPLLDEVADILDHQPHAMAAAAEYVRQQDGKFSWRYVLKRLEEGRRDEIEKPLSLKNHVYPSTMFEAVRSAVKKSADDKLILKKTFQLFASTSYKSLPIHDVYNQLSPDHDDCEIYLAIKHCSLFFIKNSGNDVAMHRVVYQATKTLFTAPSAT